MARCTLCGGKVLQGRCLECGWDNTKTDAKYHLNTHNDETSVFHKGDCEDHINRDRLTGRKKGGSAIPNKPKPSPAKQADRTLAQRAGMQPSAAPNVPRPKEGQQQKKKNPGMFFIFIIVYLFILFMNLIRG